MQTGFAGKEELFLCFSSKVQRLCSSNSERLVQDMPWNKKTILTEFAPWPED